MFSLSRNSFLSLGVIPLLQNCPPDSLYFYDGIAEHPHIIDILKLEFEHFEVVFFRVLSRLPLLKVVWYELAFAFTYQKGVPLLHKNNSVVQNFQARKTIHYEMLCFRILLQRVLLVTKNLQTFHPQNRLNSFQSVQLIGLQIEHTQIDNFTNSELFMEFGDMVVGKIQFYQIDAFREEI